jgi:NAD dependent epimerase/dehydratase family enzyme
VVILTRQVSERLPFRQVVWDARTVGPWAEQLSGPGPVAVVNLAGKLVDCRPTPDNIAALTRSRVDATRALVLASQQLDRPVERWLQSSTTAIYSDAGEARLDESSPLPVPGLPQMTGVARAWEDAFDGANTTAHTVLRTSIVLANGCPAWDRLALLARSGAGGTVGPGTQWFSWIHLDDWLRIADTVLGLEPALALPNGELMALLRQAFHRPGLPTPTALVRLGAWALRTDPALALTGRHATSTVLDQAGFRFRHPDLATTVKELAAGGR